MEGYVAPTDPGWYNYLARKHFWDEVNFWRPSAHYGFRSPAGSPFFFKLKAPYNAICGLGLVARFARLPEWLAWESFGEANGAASFAEMERRLKGIRLRNKVQDAGPVPQIGCILLSTAVFFPQELWIPQPADWPVRNQREKQYDLSEGEGLRIWRDCEQHLMALRADIGDTADMPSNERIVAEDALERFGKPQLIAPRLGQGAFRIAVTDAYGRACAVTREHSLPALEAAHIKPYRKDGPHAIANGLLLRADLHRLFDQGYLTVTPQRRLEISRHLKIDYENGRSYYPHHGRQITLPANPAWQPDPGFLRWHNDNVYRV